MDTMITRLIFTSLLILALVALWCAPVSAIRLRGTYQTWTLTIGTANLGPPIEGGQDLTPSYTSTTATTRLNIQQTTGRGDAWRVDVRRGAGSWPFLLEIDRTANGSSNNGGTISPDPGYIQVTTTDQQFFSGSGNRNNVNCLYRLGNVNLLVPPGTYSTTVIFTLVNL